MLSIVIFTRFDVGYKLCLKEKERQKEREEEEKEREGEKEGKRRESILMTRDKFVTDVI